MPRSPESAAREQQRKAEYNRRKKEGTMSKQKPARGPTVEMELRIADIDTTATQLVRAELNQEAVDRYSEVSDLLPPIDVFQGGGKWFAGDGGHRIAGRMKAGHSKIKANVTDCKTEEAAFFEARRFALGANTQHGLPRSNEDKQQSVRSALLVPEYGEQSDREVAELCHVSHQLVGDIRHDMTEKKQLTGKAASKRTTPVRDRSKKAEAESQPTSQSGRATTSTTQETDDDQPTPPASPSAAIPMPRMKGDQLIDARGRVVPESLAPQFKLGKAFVNDFRSMLNEMMESVASATEEPWGVGYKATLQTFQNDFKKISEDVGAAIPYCCCPHVNADGVHELGGKCKVCIDNRGWLSRSNWHQQNDHIKQLIDEQATEKPQTEAA
jgi:hypothetical protein